MIWTVISIFLVIFAFIFYHEDHLIGFITILYSICMCGVFSSMSYKDLKDRVKNLEEQLKEREEK